MYSKISYIIFGRIVKSLKVYFYDVKDDLYKANINYTLDEWLSMALFSSLIVFLLGNIFMTFLFSNFVPFLVAVFLSFTLCIGFAAFSFFIFYIFPSTVGKNRESKIEKSLPFAVSYLATISSGGTNPINMFKVLSKFDEYGEVTKESKNIVRDVDVFGMTFSSTLSKHAKRNPSKSFRELLRGINTIVESGGDLTGFLKQKNDELMNSYRGQIKKYSQNLSLFVEIYLTLVITSSIFFIVLSSVINTISGGLGTAEIQTFVIFFLLPLFSIGFILIIKGMSPLE